MTKEKTKVFVIAVYDENQVIKGYHTVTTPFTDLTPECDDFEELILTPLVDSFDFDPMTESYDVVN